MSCNGCRVLRKGCSDDCILRSCLHWIPSPQAQANATLFVAKFFGRSDLMSFISAVRESQRPAMFQSLLFEACGRTVNPVNGAVGLLSSGNWEVCQTAVQTVLASGDLKPVLGGVGDMGRMNGGGKGYRGRRSVATKRRKDVVSFCSERVENDDVDGQISGGVEGKLLNLFV